MSGRLPERVVRIAPAAAAAAAIVLQAVVARLLLNADEQRVYWLGRPIDVECAFRARFGLPCPGCGLTRSVVLALHGHFLRSWNMAPGGAAAVAGGLALAAGLGALAIFGLRGSPAARRLRVELPRWAIAAAGVVFVIWAGGWATAFAQAIAHRF